MAYRILIIGGTGQVGAAVIRALLATPSCVEIVMVNRREVGIAADPRLSQVVLDTSAAEFADEVARRARDLLALGEPVYAVSCVGVGSGSAKWSEDQLKALEIGVVGSFARGCHVAGITHFALLSAVGSNPKSRFRYVRVMGMKEAAIETIGFKRLAIFRPGIIAGNAHTPGYVAWLGRLVPGRFGVVEQDDIGRAFVAEFNAADGGSGVTYLENGEMRRMSRSA
ncbi:hypothetical protein L2Y96_08340 [Luteibacter aegosomaticola]|uniref:hypothetical protein n=1 Tax=Luteibacter aegosomaticola TaxID=2911538 RepID=UPI001FFA7EB5|nr:hypothetical protein [Luteibacter aegosomaticola]UPG91761.1 hypothetical protein L2Y96_08340 [Luteibacter aegosomaticola]